MIDNPILIQAMNILEQEFSCHTIILYASSKGHEQVGLNDYNFIAFNDLADSFKISRILDGEYLDLAIYPRDKIQTPDKSMLKAIEHSIILKQKEGLGDLFMSRLLALYNNQAYGLSDREKKAQKIEALKIFERAYVGDMAGKHQKNGLLFSQLESYFQLRDLPYSGVKKALNFLSQQDPKTYHYFENALTTSEMFDLIRLIHRVTQADKKYYVMRHAETEPNAQDLQRVLTEVGKNQCEKVSEFLTKTPFDLAICSTALRTQQTAKGVLKERKIKTHSIEALYFPVNPKIAKIQEIGKNYAINALLQIMKISLETDSNTILVVGHGGIINLIGYLIDSELKPLLHKAFAPSEGFYLNA